MDDCTRPEARYQPLQHGRSLWLDVRGLQYHVRCWGDASTVTAQRPALVLLHGWMDVAASFQFLVDALAEREGEARFIVAPDWRGFGWTRVPGADSYWFPDYLADLDALLRQPALGLASDTPVDLVGHSMGGNIAMVYAGVRPQRIRRLVNLEGFGLPATRPEQAPERYRQWLDGLQSPGTLQSYRSVDDVAARLRRNNPRLSAPRAAWLAAHWSHRDEAGRWHLLADAAHKQVNPVLYHVDEVLACWRAISAPVLWVDGDLTDTAVWWGHRYPRSEFEQRLAVVPQLSRQRLSPSGHMLHHDQPEALADTLRRHLA
ncbi:pimeloyl-ACP methyl ester carboxylesterase [Sphaerotilus hippei]|uniref:Pimeloyl-ACP methyl ester carboxylesterase n=1 Tax=Sphaerotilus hippei TaxID=744406 RepID=A0A318GY96_9BURK|nr:alpha/beta fold hydrolase [Sphaerotilus hippei]PXW94992.1 pimeloyl-ACP methyl ester carboxylesterase [Sphaerotilus hippei]